MGRPEKLSYDFYSKTLNPTFLFVRFMPVDRDLPTISDDFPALRRVAAAGRILSHQFRFFVHFTADAPLEFFFRITVLGNFLLFFGLPFLLKNKQKCVITTCLVSCPFRLQSCTDHGTSFTSSPSLFVCSFYFLPICGSI